MAHGRLGIGQNLEYHWTGPLNHSFSVVSLTQVLSRIRYGYVGHIQDDKCNAMHCAELEKLFLAGLPYNEKNHPN